LPTWAWQEIVAAGSAEETRLKSWHGQRGHAEAAQ